MAFKTNDLIGRHYFKACFGSVALFILLILLDQSNILRDCEEQTCVKQGAKERDILMNELVLVSMGVYVSVAVASAIRMHSQRLNLIAMIKENRKAFYDMHPIASLNMIIALIGILTMLLKILPSCYWVQGNIPSLVDRLNFDWVIWNGMAACTPLIGFGMASLSSMSKFTGEEKIFLGLLVVGMVVFKYAIVYSAIHTVSNIWRLKDQAFLFCIWALCLMTYLSAGRRIRKVADRSVRLSSSIEKNALKTFINHDNEYLYIGLLAYRQLTMARCLFIGLSFYILLLSLYFTGIVSFRTAEILFLLVSSSFNVMYTLLAINAGLETTHRSLYQWEIERKAHADRRAFLRYVFHEVRVPLNSISLGIELLSDVNLGDTDRETVMMMREAATFMGETLNDVLAIQRIEEGALKLIAKPFNVDDLICVSIEPFLSLAEDKGIQVISSISPEVPMFVIGDKYRLKHVLMNLISNAVKFSRPQTAVKVIVDVFNIEDEVMLVESGLDLTAFRKLMSSSRNNSEGSASKDDDSRLSAMFDMRSNSNDDSFNHEHPEIDVQSLEPSRKGEGLDPNIIIYQISIIDEGSGISKAHLENLFNPFLTNHAGELKKGRGTGAGLAISNEIVKLHGGTIHVSSDINIGSVFTVYVPLKVVVKDSPEYNNQQSLSTASIDYENQHAIKASIESTQTSRHFAIFNEERMRADSLEGATEDASRSRSSDAPLPLISGRERHVIVENVSLLSDDEYSTTSTPTSSAAAAVMSARSVMSSPSQLLIGRKKINDTTSNNSTSPTFSQLPPRYKVNNKNISGVTSARSRTGSGEVVPSTVSVDSTSSTTTTTSNLFNTASSVSSTIASNNEAIAKAAAAATSAVAANPGLNSAVSDQHRMRKSSKVNKLNSQDMHALSSIGLQPLKPDVFPNVVHTLPLPAAGSNAASSIPSSGDASPHTTPRLDSNTAMSSSAVFLNATQIQNYESWLAALDKLSEGRQNSGERTPGLGPGFVGPGLGGGSALEIQSPFKSDFPQGIDIPSAPTAMNATLAVATTSPMLVSSPDCERVSDCCSVDTARSEDAVDNNNNNVKDTTIIPTIIKRRLSKTVGDAASEAAKSELEKESSPKLTAAGIARFHSDTININTSPIPASRVRKDSQASVGSSNSTTPRETYLDLFPPPSETKQRAHSFCSSLTSSETSPRSSLFSLAAGGGVGVSGSSSSGSTARGTDDIMVGIGGGAGAGGDAIISPRALMQSTGSGGSFNDFIPTPRTSRSYTVSATTVRMVRLEPLRGLKPGGPDTPSNNSSKMSSPSGSFHYTCACEQASCNICSLKSVLASTSTNNNNNSNSNSSSSNSFHPVMQHSASVSASPNRAAVMSLMAPPDEDDSNNNSSNSTASTPHPFVPPPLIHCTSSNGSVEHREFKRHVLTARGQATPPSPAVSLPVVESPAINALIVDDVQSNRKLLAQLLSKKGLIVHLCEDGLMALEKVSSLPLDTFQVIFMDNTMPNMTGIECTKALRRLGFNQIIIGLTGNSLEEELIEFASVGADMALTKPLRPTVLDVMIRWFSQNGFTSREDQNLFVDHEQIMWVPKSTGQRRSSSHSDFKTLK